jgi:hypothetical protein
LIADCHCLTVLNAEPGIPALASQPDLGSIAPHQANPQYQLSGLHSEFLPEGCPTSKDKCFPQLSERQTLRFRGRAVQVFWTQ